MTKKRLLLTIRLWLTPGSSKRTKFLRKKKVFRYLGNDCSIMDRRIPLYSKLISIGNNVHLASNVDFVTHDIIHEMLKNHGGGGHIFQKKLAVSTLAITYLLEVILKFFTTLILVRT